MFDDRYVVSSGILCIVVYLCMLFIVCAFASDRIRRPRWMQWSVILFCLAILLPGIGILVTLFLTLIIYQDFPFYSYRSRGVESITTISFYLAPVLMLISVCVGLIAVMPKIHRAESPNQSQGHQGGIPTKRVDCRINPIKHKFTRNKRHLNRIPLQHNIFLLYNRIR